MLAAARMKMIRRMMIATESTNWDPVSRGLIGSVRAFSTVRFTIGVVGGGQSQTASYPTVVRSRRSGLPNYVSAMHEFTKRPIDSISISTVSPGCRNLGGVRATPTPDGVPV